MPQKGRVPLQGGALLSSHLPFILSKGLLLTLFFSFLVLVASALLSYFSPLPEFLVSFIIFGGTLFSIVCGSFYVGKRVDERGWLRGGLTGFLSVLVIIILGFFLPTGLALGLNVIPKLFLGFSFGVVGGIIGINS